MLNLSTFFITFYQSFSKIVLVDIFGQSKYLAECNKNWEKDKKSQILLKVKKNLNAKKRISKLEYLKTNLKT